MLKYRLIFGLLMTFVLAGLMVADGYIDGSISSSVENAGVQGTILCVIICLLMIAAQFELAKLAAAVGFKIFTPVAIVSSVLLATSFYWQQVFEVRLGVYIGVVGALAVMATFFYQGFKYGTAGVIGNCGANCLAILYTGLLSSFVLAIRVEYGVWALLMVIFTVKSSDIGAYTVGKLFGRHKFSPSISPGKTWEGMAGAAMFSGLVGSLFAKYTGIMAWEAGLAFGVLFAFIGQLGDLAESMLKRDAAMKDSSKNIPGFGGVLDIIDSPLIAAMPAYVFFELFARG